MKKEEKSQLKGLRKTINERRKVIRPTFEWQPTNEWNGVVVDMKVTLKMLWVAISICISNSRSLAVDSFTHVSSRYSNYKGGNDPVNVDLSSANANGSFGRNRFILWIGRECIKVSLSAKIRTMEMGCSSWNIGNLVARGRLEQERCSPDHNSLDLL